MLSPLTPTLSPQKGRGGGRNRIHSSRYAAVLILRIRQAEVALGDGRLDEAYELCQSEKLRSHRKGQALVTRLVRALVKRGHEHLNAARPQQALVDCEKASRLGGALAEVVELRSVATEQIAENQ